MISSYQHLSTNLVAANKQAEGTDLLVIGAKATATVAGEVVKSVPIIGGVVSAIDKVIDLISEAVFKAKVEAKANAVSRMVEAKFPLQEDLSPGVAELALYILDAKKQELNELQVDKDPDSIGWFRTKIMQIKEMLVGNVEEHYHNGPVADEALADVAVFFIFVLEHHQRIVDSEEPFDQAVIEGIPAIKEIVEQNEALLLERDESSACGISSSGSISPASGKFLSPPPEEDVSVGEVDDPMALAGQHLPPPKEDGDCCCVVQ